MKVNGISQNLSERVTLRCFLERNGYDCTRVAVERNGEIVPRGSFGDILLDDSDTIEIVRFVGGG
jgi:sulfur carrier protein